IVIALFFLTDPDIIDLLRLKRSTGVTVKIVIDNLGLGSRVAKKKESLSQLLKIYKLEHWKDDGAGHWHHKAAVIDKKVVLSGSANWSQSAFTKNDENLLQMEHPELAIKLEKILEAKKSFIYWNPNSTIMTQNLIIPKYWRLTRQKDSLRVQLPSNAGEWQVRVNKVPIKTKISKLNTIDFIDHTFFNSKKDQFLDLYHPRFKRLHSLFLSNQDNSLSKKSILLIKSSLIRNPLSGCLSGNPTDENCLESKIKFNGCRQASVDNLKAGFWKNCDNITRID
ncbi:MAG: phospholipase D-like domain-containing protein, partial [bacterium]|nr:phospholipase D-like domain-containing protein [bacterium]